MRYFIFVLAAAMAAPASAEWQLTDHEGETAIRLTGTDIASCQPGLTPSLTVFCEEGEPTIALVHWCDTSGNPIRMSLAGENGQGQNSALWATSGSRGILDPSLTQQIVLGHEALGKISLALQTRNGPFASTIFDLAGFREAARSANLTCIRP